MPATGGPAPGTGVRAGYKHPGLLESVGSQSSSWSRGLLNGSRGVGEGVCPQNQLLWGPLRAMWVRSSALAHGAEPRPPIWMELLWSQLPHFKIISKADCDHYDHPGLADSNTRRDTAEATRAGNYNVIFVNCTTQY